jgi:MFS superfamily sulfate permease-like transporter
MTTETKKRYIPADGLAGLKESFSKDALSGFLVFLLALPLSLGIAKASDFPAIFGLVTAIIGGVVVSFFAGSRLTIKGPAAGLIAICGGAIAAFGGGDTGWHLALGAIVVAGIVQVLFGVFKLGKLADFFPGAAIHGMLAAIGIIIMSKQIHTLLGIDPKMLKGKEPLELLAMIPESIMHENAHIAEIGIACLLILIGMSFVKHQKIKKIPAPLIVLIVAIPMGIWLNIKTDGAISNFSLVKIGSIFESFTSGFTMKGDFISRGVLNADFSALSSHMGDFIMYVILFALIGSLESLLTAKAIDGLDPYKRKSDFNKDLIAVGIGNTFTGLLGGLPMISEVARSSANVSNGAKTRWANFFHGLFLLLAVLVAVPVIEMIPNAALAAMLTFVGFKLAHPKEFMHMWHVGKEQFMVFTATVVVTLATDLLVGVGTGIALEIIVNLINGASVKSLFKSDVTITNQTANDITLTVNNGLVFSNILGFKKSFATLPKGKNVTIDVSSAEIVDHTSILTLNGLVEDYKFDGGTIEVNGFDHHKQLGHDGTSTRVLKLKLS